MVLLRHHLVVLCVAMGPHVPIRNERIEMDEQGRPRFELHANGFGDIAAGELSVEEKVPCTLNLRFA